MCTAQWSLCVPHSGHYVYHQFIIHKSYVLPTQLYLCVLCGSQNKQRLFPYTTLTDWFLYNRDAVCLLRGTDWIFICDSGECYRLPMSYPKPRCTAPFSSTPLTIYFKILHKSQPLQPSMTIQPHCSPPNTKFNPNSHAAAYRNFHFR